MRSSPDSLPTGHAVLYALVVAVAGAAVGVACGATTRSPSRADVRPDTERGMLARASRGVAGDARFSLGGAAPDAAAERGTGGTRYGDYHFVWHMRRWRRVQPPYIREYTGVELLGPGAIEGRVVWPRPPRVPPTVTVCGRAVRNDAVSLDHTGGVANAVVHLRDITRGRAGVRPSRYHKAQLGGVLDHRRCRLFPRVQLVAPIGARLRVRNASAPGAVIARRVDTGTLVFSLELARGARDHVYLDEPGTLAITATGAPAPAWAIVPDHPYYDITDDNGRFRLDEVPPGEYTIAVWHPPVAADAFAVTAARKIRVAARRTRSVTIALPSGR